MSLSPNLYPYIVQCREKLPITKTITFVFDISNSLTESDVIKHVDEYRKKIADDIFDKIGKDKDIYIHDFKIEADDNIYITEDIADYINKCAKLVHSDKRVVPSKEKQNLCRIRSIVVLGYRDKI